MQVKIIALTSKGEEALRKYIDSSIQVEKAMNELSSVNPKKIKFKISQASAKRIVLEEYFENPLMIVATIQPKYSTQAYLFIPKIETEFRKIMLNSNCGKEDYNIEVL